MAEITTPATGKKNRSHRLSVRIDMTPMVDLGFLLITFFMLTTSLSKPKALPLAMPDQAESTQPVPASSTLTLLLSEQNKITYFVGLPNVTTTQVTDFSQIRAVLLQKKKEIGPKLFVIIRASKQAKYHNLVDMLDELAITDCQRYAIAEFTANETALLRKE
ncbi:MAG: biopolymer transporter ExbD [Spirosomataceae bacterium]